jgi:hypothetical protein
MGVLQERYGYTRERADEEITRRVREYETSERNRGADRL